MIDIKHAEFMQVGDFVTNFGGNELEHTEDLVGRSLVIHFHNSQVIKYVFLPGQKMEWHFLPGDGLDQVDEVVFSEKYRASCIRQGYYLVDFVKLRNPTESVTLVLDLVKNIATSVVATMPTRECTLKPLFQRVVDREMLSPMRHEILSGSIDQAFSENTPRHQPTEELVGKRVLYQYGPKDSYEHIYLNREFYTWHCIQGPESGLADTDFCRYFKLANSLYLFVWFEKVIPTVGVIIIDFTRAKTTGKIFGYQGEDFGATCNTPVGAFLTLKNETRY